LRGSENAPNGPSILGFGRVMQQEFPKACCQEGKSGKNAAFLPLVFRSGYLAEVTLVDAG